MVGASKILTVSYGTFSCTLEGFDDPFSAMRSIAEYFRDLAADDRYFGAEPPTPDAEMLHRIAEQEVQRRVEARVETNGVVLRQMDAADAAAPVAEAPVASEVEEPVAEDAPADTTEDLAEDLVEAVAETEEEEIVAAELAVEDEAEVDPGLAEAFADASDEAAPAAEDTAEAEVQEEPEAESHESVAEKLSRIRAAVSGGAPAAVAGAAGVAAVAVGSSKDDAEETDDASASDDTLADAFADVQDTVAFDDVPEALLSDEIGEVANESDEAGSDEAADNPLTDETPAEPVEAEAETPEADAQEDEASETAEDATTLEADEATEEDTADVAESADAQSEDAGDDVTAQDDALVLEDAVLDATEDEIEDEAEEVLTLDDDLRLGDTMEDESAELAKLDGIEEDLAPIGSDDEEDLAVLTDDASEDSAQDEAQAEAEATPVAFPEVGDGSDEVELMPARVVTLRRADPLENNLDEDSATEDHLEAGAEDDEELLRELASIGEGDDEIVEPEAEAVAEVEASDAGDDAAESIAEEASTDVEDTVESDASEEEAEADSGEDNAGLDMAIAGAMAADGGEPAAADASEEALSADTKSAPKDATDPVDRILEETNSQLDDSEGTRRRSAIAHLKAAVAATKADRLLKRMRLKEEVEQEEQKDYRDDLAQVVRPRRPAADTDADGASDGTKAEKSGERPLMLVSEQRVDSEEGTSDEADSNEAPKASVRPARVTTDMIRPRRATAEELDVLSDSEDGNENLFEPDESFSEFAEKMGATELPDVLEAAAAYSAFVEGQKHFSRPQLMKRVASFEMNEEFTREAGLRSFGQLLRQGKIQKLKRGQFTIREDTRFRPEARIAGE